MAQKPAPIWHRSRYCPQCDGQCVEVASMDGKVALRDSKDPGGPVLTFTVGEFDTFLEGVRSGDFDSFAR